MPFWNRKNRTRTLTQDVVKQLRSTRQSRVNRPMVSDRIACVIAVLQDQPEWDYAINQKAAHEAALYAANYMGFIQPYDAEEKALFDYLSAHFAGRKISTFAWGLYADQLRGDETPLLLTEKV